MVQLSASGNRRSIRPAAYVRRACAIREVGLYRRRQPRHLIQEFEMKTLAVALLSIAGGALASPTVSPPVVLTSPIPGSPSGTIQGSDGPAVACGGGVCLVVWADYRK